MVKTLICNWADRIENEAAELKVKESEIKDELVEILEEERGQLLPSEEKEEIANSEEDLLDLIAKKSNSAESAALERLFMKAGGYGYPSGLWLEEANTMFDELCAAFPKDEIQFELTEEAALDYESTVRFDIFNENVSDEDAIDRIKKTSENYPDFKLAVYVGEGDFEELKPSYFQNGRLVKG